MLILKTILNVSALRGISKNNPVLTKTIQQDEGEDSEEIGEEGRSEGKGVVGW